MIPKIIYYLEDAMSELKWKKKKKSTKYKVVLLGTNKNFW